MCQGIGQEIKRIGRSSIDIGSGDVPQPWRGQFNQLLRIDEPEFGHTVAYTLGWVGRYWFHCKEWSYAWNNNKVRERDTVATMMLEKKHLINVPDFHFHSILFPCLCFRSSFSLFLYFRHCCRLFLCLRHCYYLFLYLFCRRRPCWRRKNARIVVECCYCHRCRCWVFSSPRRERQRRSRRSGQGSIDASMTMMMMMMMMMTMMMMTSPASWRWSRKSKTKFCVYPSGEGRRSTIVGGKEASKEGRKMSWMMPLDAWLAWGSMHFVGGTTLPISNVGWW